MRACLILFGLLLSTLALAGVDEDWQTIVALDAGPQGQPQTAADAQRLAIRHLDVQEKALRDFLSKHPGDARSCDAKLRLAHLLAVRGDLNGNAKATAESNKILDAMESDPALPPGKRPDVAFAKISLTMHRVIPGDEPARDALLLRARNFQKTYPTDRRNASLLAEVATLYDSEPKQKQALLEEASSTATDDELKQRIADDLKRIALLGKPLALNFASLNGTPINVETYRGKIVLIYFFAGWSPPSLMVLGRIQRALAKYPASKVQPIGISLDENKDALLQMLKTYKIDWPIGFDGKGWTSPVIRSLGINALPTVWILDRAGNLRTLNARDDADSVIRHLLR